MKINLKDFRDVPCEDYLKFFDEDGNVDILDMSEGLEQRKGWQWIFENANNFDWFVSDEFDWERFSYLIPGFASHLFDKDKYNWKKDSWFVEKFAPELLHLKPETL